MAGPAAVTLADGRVVRLADVRPVPMREERPPREGVTGSARLLPVTGAGPDRYGRILGDVVPDATGESLSIALLERGLAFVDPAVMQEGCHDDLLAAERRAEAARRGVWAGADRVLSASHEGLTGRVGEYVIVEGTVDRVGGTRRTVYLNFGPDWRTDFTALVRRRGSGRWAAALDRLEGRRVRIRGVLEAWNGGLIRIEHPAQVEAR